MHDTDGNLYALNKHLAECEEYDRYQELLEAERERDELADRVDRLEFALLDAIEGFEMIANIEPDDIGRFHDIANELIAKIDGVRNA